MKYRCPKCTMKHKIKKKIPKKCPFCEMKWDEEKIQEELRNE